MNAQAQTIPDKPKPKPEYPQVTPVIIKIGGDGGGNEFAEDIPIKLDSGFMDWSDNSGATWNEASSSFSGRIHELTLQDGNLQPVYCKVHPESDVLTSLKLYFETSEGTLTFEVNEVEGADGLITLQAQSPSVMFQAHDPNTDGEWHKSEAKFSGTLVKARFRQRKNGSDDDMMKFEYVFNSNDINLNLDFHATF